MACEILGSEGPVLRIRISGVMSVADLLMLQEASLELIRQGNNIRALVMLENFQGWEHSSAWNQTSFMPDQEKQLQKMAFVGDEQWRDKACAFVGKGLRTFEIDYFLPSACAEAERWLQS